MSRTGANPFFRRVAAAALAMAVLGAGGNVPAATLVVSVESRDGRPLAGAVLTADPQGQRVPAPGPASAVVDQVDLAFVPDVVVVPTGSSISFPNSDAVSHQVYSFSSTRRFQLPLYRGKPYPPVVFDQPGVVTLGCNIHDNMLAYIIVTSAPFFGRSDAQGRWTVPGVPGGRYRLQLWHPLLSEPGNTLAREIDVPSEGARLTWRLDRALKPPPLKSRPHSWDY